MTSPSGKVLILENDEGIAWLMSSRLTEKGYEVKISYNDDFSSGGIEVETFDLMIFDFKLDGIKTGLECYRELREGGIEAPMILVTGFGDESVLVEALRLGVRDFVPKTGRYLEMLDLSVDRVMEYVKKERQRKELIIAESSRAALEKSLRDVEELAERLRLSSMEAHHRVKNSFQIVTSLLSLQHRRKGSLQKDDIRVISTQVRGLSLIHDILTNLARAGKVESVISLRELVEKLVNTLPSELSDKPISVEVSTNSTVSPRIASSVAVILTELLLNALKHGSGEIEVSCVENHEKRAVLSVSNTGSLGRLETTSEAGTGTSLVRFLASTDLGAPFEQLEKNGKVTSSCSIPVIHEPGNMVKSLEDFTTFP